MEKSDKAVSPVIATVLLIAMVVVLGLIIFLWFSGLTEETITKFGGRNIKLVCDEVIFDASYSSGELTISNTGNVPIHSIELKLSATGGYSTKNIKEIFGANWPVNGVNQRGVYSGSINSEMDDDVTDILVIPVLKGTSENGQRAYTCDERNGVEVFV